MGLIKRFLADESGQLIADIGKAAAAIAFLSVIAANFLSTQIASADRDQLSQVALAAARGKLIDPQTTGSLRSQAQDTRLDPCVVKR